MNCPNCGAEMVIRTATKGRNRGNKFWACPNYFKLKKKCPSFNIENENEKEKQVSPSPWSHCKTAAEMYQWGLDNLNEGQISALKLLDETGKNILLNSCAGSGKTFVTLFLAQYASMKFNIKPEEILIVSFTNPSVDDLKRKLNADNFAADCRTLHSLGFRLHAKSTYGRITKEDFKVLNYLKSVAQFTIYESSKYVQAAQKAIKILRSYGVEEDKIENLVKAADAFVTHGKFLAPKDALNQNVITNLMFRFENLSIPLYDEYYELAVEVIHNLYFAGMEHSIQNSNEIDFGDMCWLPAYNGFIEKKYKILFIDEAQDTADSQQAMLETFLSFLKDKEIRFVFVGDKWQSIYIWRGASANSMQELKEKFNCVETGMTITYRNSIAVTNYVNQCLPYIEHTTASEIEGYVDENFSLSKMLDKITEEKEGMILCRVNAPLLKVALQLAKRGIVVKLKGSNIQDRVYNLIAECNLKPIAPVNEMLDCVWQIVEQKVKQAKRNGHTGEYWLDLYECVEILSEGHKFVSEVLQAIRDMLDNSEEKDNGVFVGTIHAAKGLESKNVYVLEPDKLSTANHEDRVLYVVLTRPIENLHLVY